VRLTFRIWLFLAYCTAVRCLLFILIAASRGLLFAIYLYSPKIQSTHIIPLNIKWTDRDIDWVIDYWVNREQRVCVCVVRQRSREMTATVHDLVEWSSTSDQCDIQKFVEKYGRYIPLLVRIADGYAGRDESMHLFAQNEVRSPRWHFYPLRLYLILVLVYFL